MSAVEVTIPGLVIPDTVDEFLTLCGDTEAATLIMRVHSRRKGWAPVARFPLPLPKRPPVGFESVTVHTWEVTTKVKRIGTLIEQPGGAFDQVANDVPGLLQMWPGDTFILTYRISAVAA